MWHPHVYASPPKQPTPFSINDILDLKSDQQSREDKDLLHPLQIQTNNIISFFGANKMNFPLAQVIPSFNFTFKEYCNNNGWKEIYTCTVKNTDNRR